MEVLVQELPKSKFLSVSGAEPPVVKKDWKLVDIDATSGLGGKRKEVGCGYKGQDTQQLSFWIIYIQYVPVGTSSLVYIVPNL
jgi:hypothetical protein